MLSREHIANTARGATMNDEEETMSEPREARDPKGRRLAIGGLRHVLLRIS